MLEALEPHLGKIIVFVMCLIGGLTIYKFWKCRNLFELDKQFKRYNDKGEIIQETRSRNIWDYNFFPGLSKLWHISEWQILVAMVILLLLLILYLFRKDNALLNLLSVNFGILLGMMIMIKKSR